MILRGGMQLYYQTSLNINQMNNKQYALWATIGD